VCIDCANGALGTTTNCPDGLWCYAEDDGICTALECSADTDCLITEICTSEMKCETMTCGASTNASDANDLNCCRAQSNEPDHCSGTQLCVSDVCTACTVDEDGEDDCVSTSDNSLFCNDTAGDAMEGACYSIACDTSADCVEYYENCDSNSQCRDATGCVADASICRGVGTDVYGACDSTGDVCVECTVTVTDGVTSSDCPTANTYCNTAT
jgi:hypothetical protein